MGATYFYGYYPKECNNPNIIPFLKVNNDYFDNSVNGKHQKEEFYEILRNTKYNENGYCWIFTDKENIFKLATVADERMCDYITNPTFIYYPFEEQLKDDIFIIWDR